MSVLDVAARLGPLLGGVGLFLLGMAMMTDGLKLAAGPALEQILARSTRTRLHGLASGALITAAVQSSSAVTVAAIGFVNAGLLSLSQALWVLFGSNVGTTFTGWLVALVGLRVKVDAFALPLVGLGALLKLFGRAPSLAATGQAVAGFGVLFLGIGLLQQAFLGFADDVRLPAGEGLWGVLALVAIGAALTVVMQASAASMAMALTAAQSGLIDVQGAAAVVIGANIGTTVTALLASVGATPNAKRAAAAHVLFNVLTAAVALALLPWLVAAIGWAREALGLDRDPAAKLALFHSIFNVLGVLLMWPLAGVLTRWLLARFRTIEEDEARPRYLDDNALQVPVIALDALRREVRRAGVIAVRLARGAVGGAAPAVLERDRALHAALARAIERFVERLHRGAMNADSSERLPRILRVERYHETCAELAFEAATAQADAAAAALPDAAAAADADFRHHASALLYALAVPDEAGAQEPVVTPAIDRLLEATENAYQSLKAALLAAGADGRLPLSAMDARLRAASALRRALQQAVKAVRLDADIAADSHHAE
ncbi:Na/Pi cotransporter family protein [Azohydromonas sediminis]|uniref:Na/Pi cotransporter family protein n=1 Tax=Azohydromonas sediminis TaxID=2259674 RepID=UPI000E652F10|nr:Na/Pi symporter [Azohydromonas sediminis]